MYKTDDGKAIQMQTVHIQLWGEQRAVPVEELKPGMVTVWTGVSKAEISGVVASKSGKTYQIVYADGRTDHRKMRKGRLVAVA